MIVLFYMKAIPYECVVLEKLESKYKNYYKKKENFANFTIGTNNEIPRTLYLDI